MSEFTDVDGNGYVDYLMGPGPLVLGHRPPEVTAAMAGREGIEAVPSVEMVRFANSGSEMSTAVRLAGEGALASS